MRVDYKKYFIWTEGLYCPKTLNIALESFCKFHDNIRIHVFVKGKDWNYIKKLQRTETPFAGKVVPQIVTCSRYSKADALNKEICNKILYKGHEGIAVLWTSLIKQLPHKYMIHFDSDVIFKSNLIEEIIEKCEEGYDLVGPRRSYVNNPHGFNGTGYTDVIQTCCFAFNREKVNPEHEFGKLSRMVQGCPVPSDNIIKTIDFFDPVSFEILNNNGKIYYLDHDDVGGCNEMGSRDNCFADKNNGNTAYKIDFGRKLVHFSAVGSGEKYAYSKDYITECHLNKIPQHYIDYALDRFYLFSKIFYGDNWNNEWDKASDKYKYLTDIKEWF